MTRVDFIGHLPKDFMFAFPGVLTEYRRKGLQLLDS